MLEVYDLKVEHLIDPIGIDARYPRFSWKIRSDRTGVRQTSYQLIVEDGQRTVWNIKEYSRQNQTVYQGVNLCSRQRLIWTLYVEAVDDSGQTDTDSQTGCFEMGLLEERDWQATWIEPEESFDMFEKQPAPYLRKSFTVRKGLVKARAYQTAHGIYQFWLNGKEGSVRRFAPGNTSYYHRLQYQVDDVTGLLREGENVWAVILADGWWRGAYGAFGNRNNYGDKLHFLGQLELYYEDGTTEVITSDENFRCSVGGLVQADMKLGSIFDASAEPRGWKICGYDDSSWKRVHPGDRGHGGFHMLIAEQTDKMAEQEVFTPRAFRDSKNQLVLDFGQNIAGYMKMTFHNLEKGQRIILEHGEGLKDGAFDNSNINIKENAVDDMFQQVVYIAAGRKIETFTPLFSVFGFRYVKIEGYKEEIWPGDFQAAAVYTTMETTLDFQSSHTLLNKFMSNTLWSQKGNFLDVPTDCPTRERAPWTGDAQVYCRTAAEFMDVYAFFEKWMKEMNCELADNGQVPSIIPSISFHSEKCREYMLDKLAKIPEKRHLTAMLSGGKQGEPQMLDGCAGWGDAAVVIPYMMYLQYGDKRIIENQYLTAKRWVEYELAQAKIPNPVYQEETQYHHRTDGVLDADYIWDTGFHWGEWSEPDFVHRTLPENFMDDKLKYGEPVVATAYLAYSSGILAKMAGLIHEEEDAVYYGKVHQRVTDIYDKYFVMEDGSIRYSDAGRQAAYVRVLAFDLCGRKKRSAVLQRILQMIREEDYHLNTGFLSTALLLNVLAEEGETETAYRILEQTTPPSWLYPVANGMTTNMESWDGVQRYFGSFNHYSFGAATDFVFRYISGIGLDEKHPGYRHFYLKPLPGGSLTCACMTFESPYGRIRSCWEKRENKILYEFEVPANTTAVIMLPKGTTKKVGSGIYHYEEII